jgi:predicted MPP superfamily phosphohydrolase
MSSFTFIGALSGIAAHWVLYRWAVAVWPRLARARVPLALLVLVILVLQAVTRRMATSTHDAGLSNLHAAIVFEVLVVAFSAIPILVLRAVTWLTMPKRARVTDTTPLAAKPPAMPTLSRRQVVEGAVGASFLTATGSMLGWGMVRGRHAFEIDEVVVRIAGLPRALDGYTIAQVSDIHTGIYIGDRELAEGFSRVAEARPDLLVVTGDMVDFDPTYARKLARKIADARPRDGAVAILGNHDYYTGANLVSAALRDAGVELLVNEGRLVRPADGGGFALLGVDDVGARRYRSEGPNLARALAPLPPDRARILLSHQPPTIDRWAGQVALQLSGHTHGGQINPGFRPADLFFHYVAGRYEVRGTTLWVNRGFGTVGPPSRVMAPPEVTRVILVAA